MTSSTPADAPDARIGDVGHPLLDVDRLSVTFRTRAGDVHAVRDVSLKVRRGQVVGIVGESGSGKSVTAYTLLGILDRAGRISGGRVSVGGLDIATASKRALREMRGKEVSIIFQNPRAALNPIRAVGKQIADILRAHDMAAGADLTKRAVALLEQVRIRMPEQRYHAYPFELSGGMCQRVMIAMALACEPEILIADEPTTGLDVTTQKTIMDLIRDLTAERHMAVVLITHDLGLALEYCDDIVVMQQGEVVEAAPAADLFANPKHPYTQKLIRSTPRPGSTLADLAPDAGTAAPATAAPVAPLSREQPPLLEVTDLVKEFPLKGTSGWRHALNLFRTKVAQVPSATDPETFRAVDGISFHVMPGESVGLVGESGCGKSTTSRMVTRLLDPTSGSIRFDGEDLANTAAAKFSNHPLRSAIQMVFQDPTDSLNPRFTAARAIADPIYRLGTEKDEAAVKARIEALADMVGLPRPLLTRFPHQLSGGQKARVGIARAIAVDPKLLILDEPTSALDVSVQAVVLNLLDKLRRELGMAYIFVSHDLNVVRLLCSRVLVMNAGRIVEEGSAEQILARPQHAYTKTLVDAVPHFTPGRRAA